MANISTPQSLYNFSTYQSEYHERLKRLGPPYMMVASIIEPFLRDIIDKGAFYLRMHRHVLPKVLDTKCIKSQVETKHGRTEGGPETRREVTKMLFGADIDRMSDHDFPKYGYLSCDNPVIELFWGDEMQFQYGNVLVRLKKERLIHRTTLTVGMSLCFNTTEFIVPTRVDNVKATCVPGLNIDPHAPASMRSLNVYLYLANAIASGKINSDNFFKITEILGSDVPTFTYFELQYHGPVTLDDIERIDVYSEGDDEYLEQMQKRCQELGIPFEVRSL